MKIVMILPYHFILRPILPLERWEEFTISHIGRKTLNRKRNESGQAVIEYVLVILVVLLIILGSAYQFNSAFRVFVTNYFGNYTACLLETGELPAMFGGAGGTCDAEFRNYNPNDGRPLVTSPNGGGGAGGGAGGGGGGNGNDSGGASDRDRNRRKNGSTTARSDGNGSSSGGGGGGGGGFGSINKFGNSKSKPARTNVGTVQDEKSYTGSTDPSSKKGRIVGQLASEVGGSKKMSLDRRFVSIGDGDEEKEAPLKAQVDSDEGPRFRAKKIKFEVRKPAAKSEQEEGEGFSLAWLIRILLIAAIAIILFVLISGQAASISKSWEKE